jgi:hypothetical protein
MEARPSVVSSCVPVAVQFFSNLNHFCFSSLRPLKFHRLPISSLNHGNYFISLVIGAGFDLHQSIPYAAMRRLLRELKELRTSPPEGIRVQLSEESVLDVVGIIEGPGAFCGYPETKRLGPTRLCRGHTISGRLLSRKI